MNANMIEMLGGPCDGEVVPLEWLVGTCRSIYLQTEGAVHRYRSTYACAEVYEHTGFVTKQQIDELIDRGKYETHDTA